MRKGKRPQLSDRVPAEIKTLVKEGWNEKPEKRPTFVSLSESLTQPLLDRNSVGGSKLRGPMSRCEGRVPQRKTQGQCLKG